MDGIDGPSIVICTSGKGSVSVGPKKEELKEGFVFFVGATAEVVLESSGGEAFVTFRAYCEIEEGGVGAVNGKM
jgi:mannose-6-phosphate isomerase